MPDRSRLHLNKLDDFVAFAGSLGYSREPVKGDHQVLRLRRGDEPPLVFYHRWGCEHVTVSAGVAARLVNAYLRGRRSGEVTRA